MTTLRLLLGDQLSRSVSALDGLDPARDVILMAEVEGEARYVRHHKQKIVLVLSAMRHFAADLASSGLRVDYVRLDDPDNTHDLGRELARAVARHGPEAVVTTEPGEWRLREAMEAWRETLTVPLHIREDARFIASHADFAAWSRGRKQYRMEFFYREMRRKTGYLMEGDAPVGGLWNLDRDNRKPLPPTLSPPEVPRFAPDAITREVMDLVAGRFGDHFGDLEPFGWPVTRAEALTALDTFVRTRLALFGDYQDAMRTGEPFLHHAVLSPAINLGLLDPREVCEAAVAAWRTGSVPLNAVEGFIRQIIGWREFVRGIYWRHMPDYAETNHLRADRPLPAFFWSGDTSMRCLAESIGDTRRNAYAHHIQRLMVIGNFALLAGLRPSQVEEWYLIVYADAYEWVELPNVHGMVLHADGGLLASKPYAASGAYIDRMSDYCAGCRYDPAKRGGPDGCPFNALYWNFLIEQRDRLGGNPRLAMPYRSLARFEASRIAEIQAAARDFFESAEMTAY